jgi:hypothetical protein
MEVPICMGYRLLKREERGEMEDIVEWVQRFGDPTP